VTALRSLRSLLLSGALLWTVGLFIAALFLTTAAMLRYPNIPVYLHAHAKYHRHYLIVIAAVCTFVGFWLVRNGVSPLNKLRTRLARVRGGQDRRLEGAYPAEVQPLVDDLNALLEQRDQAVRRAVAKAGDLAHGLKTPLAVLAHEAERAREAGQPEVADGIAQQVERMRRQIDYHLAHARAAASGAAAGAQCEVKESAEALTRTMRRLHAARGVEIEETVPAALVVRCQREDLDEMLGNLLDNACKWAKSRVAVAAERIPAGVEILVDDDGPGLAPAMRDVVLQRGVRADEAAPGSGLGLAIVRDLAELYSGAIALEGSPLGGLRARLRLPG
jgi:signal transduction histidine kinase